MAQVMVRAIAQPPTGLLVPVPLGPGRLRRRGYNQAAALARAVGRAWTQPVAARVLCRVVETPTQTRLTPAERHRNVAGAFRASPPGPGGTGEGNRPVILVDDVLTTGATLVACASALGAAGWDVVEAITFARALPEGARVS
jgi:predicted amidophosphoribosyltransferase